MQRLEGEILQSITLPRVPNTLTDNAEGEDIVRYLKEILRVKDKEL